MKGVIDFITSLAPFLAPYHFGIKFLVACWILLTAAMVIALLLGRPLSVDKIPTDPEKGITIQTTQSNNQDVVNQTMSNSPGGIQAAGDVVVDSSSRVVQSISLHVAIETDTPETEISDPGTDMGLASILGLFTKNKERFRFITDYKILDHQFAKTRRRLSFVYKPESPIEIHGKPIDFLAEIETLAVNYQDILKTEKFDTSSDNTSLVCQVIVNGLPVAQINARVFPPGTLNNGQANLDVSNVFAQIPNAYRNALLKGGS